MAILCSRQHGHLTFYAKFTQNVKKISSKIGNYVCYKKVFITESCKNAKAFIIFVICVLADAVKSQNLQ